MYKELIITFLIFLTPIAVVEQYRKNNIHQVAYLINANEEFSFEIKNFWKKKNLASHKEYCSSDKNVFHDFKR